jgi:oligogalacturonide lyase
MRVFEDAKTKRQITQLTDVGNNVHMYFTENSFDLQKPEIIFRSDRAAPPKAPHENPHYNIFKLNFLTGELTQLTDEPEPVGSVTKTPDGALIAYLVGKKVKLLETSTGKISTLYEGENFNLNSPSISPNRQYVGFARNEKVAIVNTGVNYSGFRENFHLIKDGRITVAHVDGSGFFDAYTDTHWVGHFQYSPDDSSIAMFCHEGPWNLVGQRIWILDFIDRRARPCYRQIESDAIGHEFWTRDGLIFFDNRGDGHDGTITSDRTQAVATHVAVNQNAFKPYVGLIDRNNKLIRRLEMPFYCNHYHASPDSSQLIGDDLDEIVRIDISSDIASLEVLCQHGTSWHTQASHCHPTWSWDGKQMLYASDVGGKVNLYLMKLE